MKTATRSASANELSDGMIRFKVKDLDGKVVRELAVDALILKLCCEECETAHGYKGGDSPTAAFLADLAKRMQAIGVEGCSASIAYQLWFLAGDAISKLKKNTNEQPNSPSGSTSHPKAKGRKGK